MALRQLGHWLLLEPISRAVHATQVVQWQHGRSRTARGEVKQIWQRSSEGSRAMGSAARMSAYFARLKVHNIERRGRRVYLGSKCIRVRDSDSELGTYYPWLLSFEVSLGSRQVRWRAASTHQLPPTRSGSRVIRSRSAASCGRRDPTTLNTTSSEPRDYTENRQKRMPKGDGGWGRNRVHARGGSEARN